jgi:hypothetical protein
MMRHVVVAAGLLRQGRAALDAKAHEGPARELDGWDAAVAPPEIVPCPERACQAPAAVVGRFVLASTGGPVEHLKTCCLDGHWFTPPADML